MATRIYIFTYAGEPRFATTNLEEIKKECDEWFNSPRRGRYVQKEFSYWVEGRDEYEDTEEGKERAWNDFLNEQFESGTWGDYAWYECYLR